LNHKEIFIVGANGQLGTALRAQYPGAQFADKDELDITERKAFIVLIGRVLNISLTPQLILTLTEPKLAEGRVAAWKVNAEAASYLSEVARLHDITLVHISTDYVFDGTKDLACRG
jgi:dTDP-4-dehydrorhamnose reductase